VALRGSKPSHPSVEGGAERRSLVWTLSHPAHRERESGAGGLTREVETPLPSNSPHDHMLLRVDQRALSVTQRALSVTQRALSVTHRARSVTQRALSVTQRALRVTQRAHNVTQRARSVTQRALSITHLRRVCPPVPQQGCSPEAKPASSRRKHSGRRSESDATGFSLSAAVGPRLCTSRALLKPLLDLKDPFETPVEFKERIEIPLPGGGRADAGPPAVGGGT
jgi:hypothetical protein